MRNKRGQFYIIAAVIIVLAMIGLASVSTYAVVKTNPKVIESLSEDLKSEGPRIIDYGIYQKEDLDLLLEDFTAEEFAPFFLQKTENANIVFIYGNKTSLSGVRYNTTSTGTVSASIGGESDWYLTGPYSEKVDLTVYPGEDSLKVTILNRSYSFELKDNEMFYFVMVHEKEGEIYVQRN